MKTSASSIELTEATAERMGCDTIAIFQKDEYGKIHSVVVNRQDLERLLVAV